MRFLISEKLGPHKYKTAEGYLVCVDAILSRTGTQEYRRCELFGDACDDPDKIIAVDRKADDVFSDKTMASFENKAICIEHPNANVNVENHNDLSVGFVRDIHRGEDNGTPVMMGTLVITDKEAVEAVESGEYKELSCGYDCDIEDEHSPQQRNIRGNHVALCKQGRAGIARIVDSKVNDDVTITKSKIWHPDVYLKKEPNYEKALNDIRIMMKNADVEPYDIKISVYGSHIKFTPGDVKFDARQLKQILTQVLQQINRSLSVSSIRSRGGTVTFEIAGYQYLQEKYKVFDATKDTYTDFEYGYRDGKLGKYDKWYRYNRKDEGKEYDMGIQKAKREGYEIKNFIKGTGDSMKDELLTDMDYRDSIDDLADEETGFYALQINGQWAQLQCPGTSYKVVSSPKNATRMAQATTKSEAERLLIKGATSKLGTATVVKYKDSIEDASWEDFQAGDIIEGYDRFAGNGPENTYRVLERVGKGKYRVEPISPDAVKFAKGKKVMVIKVPEEAYKLKDSITEDSVYTVEYVKDNITHIVEIEASSLEDAILKAKDEYIKDISIAQLNEREDKLAISLGKITDYVKANGPLTVEELAKQFRMSRSDMQSHLSQLCTNIGGVKQIRAGKGFKYISDSKI